MNIFDPAILHYLITFAIAFTTIIMGFLLAGIYVPADQRLNSFRRAKQYLALSYFILGIINFISFFSQKEVQDPALLAATTLLVASYQALLFTSTILVLIQPDFVTKKFVFTHLGSITMVGAILFATLFLSEDSLFHFVFYAAAGAYSFQLVYFTRLFRHKYKEFRKKLEDYYDEDEYYRLRWVGFSFYSALGIGILALISLFVNLYLYALFGIIYTAYYAYIVHKFYNYQIDSRYIISAVIKSKEPKIASGVQKDAFSEENYAQFENALAGWVKEKRFIDKDISVEDIAKQLGTSLYFLRHYFSIHIGSDFRTWRLELRIREAEVIMGNHPELSTNEICDMVGFGDRSNFHRQFLNLTGKTPAEYRKYLLSAK